METPKELLVTQVANTANWRFEKQEQYPTDNWNNRAALSLQELEVHLKALPEDHPIFDWYWNWVNTEEEIEQFNNQLRSYGYQNDLEEPKLFIDRLLKDTISKIEEE